MKKEKIITCIENASGTYELCRCYFEYDKNYFYYYILDFNAKLFLGIEEDDFLLDGFQIRRIADIKKIETKMDVCTLINRKQEILKNVKKPAVNLGSWQTVFESLERIGCVIIIQNDFKEEFSIGRIVRVKKKSLVFQEFDADGIWQEETEILYDTITSVTFKDRYSSTLQKYLKNQSGKQEKKK
ncbi:MAG: hypothetical protein IJ642_02655 [Oscillospiraceae bacterium]|nr:hypothetical protein [Oscillospiraceae bacterium]